MQNTMLDSVVSSNSQELSSVEYVDSQKNPISTVQTETRNLVSVTPLFDFNAEHNGEACIESLRPEDRGTEHQYWFTRALLAKCFDIHRDSVTNHIEALVNRGVIEVAKNFATLKIPTNGGAQETTLYDLKVFNYLVMRLDTDQAWEKKAKFNESDKTIRNNIEELAREVELGDCKIFQRRINVEDSCGIPQRRFNPRITHTNYPEFPNRSNHECL